MVPHPWQVGNVVFICLQNYWALALCPPESTQPYPLSLQCSNATGRSSSGGGGDGNVRVTPHSVHAKSLRWGRCWWKGRHSNYSFCCTFFLKKKKKKNKCKWTTLSYSLWIISEESQHHCGGPKVILLPTPLGVSRSLTLDEPKNSLTPPSHSIRNHLWTDNLLPFWSITVSWMASWTSYGFGHTGWECQVHSLRLMVQRHSKCLQCPSLLAWPVASGPLGRLPDSLWDATPPKDWRTQLHGSHNTLIVG